MYTERQFQVLKSSVEKFGEEAAYVLSRAEDFRVFYKTQYIAVCGKTILSAGWDKKGVGETGEWLSESFCDGRKVLVNTVEAIISESEDVLRRLGELD